jgi:hypothetical protein
MGRAWQVGTEGVTPAEEKNLYYRESWTEITCDERDGGLVYIIRQNDTEDWFLER